MNIGIITETLNQPLTGVGVYTQELIKNLSKIDKKNMYYFINNNDIKTEPAITGKNILIIKNPFRIMSKTYMWYPYLCIKLKKSDFDIIHNPSQVPTFFKFKSKYIITIHDLTPLLYPSNHKYGKNYIYRLLLPRTLSNSSKIIAVSNNTRNDLIQMFDVSPEKIKVIYEGVREKFRILKKENIEKIKERYSIDFPFIICIGTLEPRKNIPRLIEAFYYLKKSGLNHKLLIIGSEGWKYRNIYSTIQKLKLSNHVIFTGYIPEEDLVGLYNASDLFVYPSIYEGFGIPPLEAMACGCPVITSNVSSLPEVVGGAAITINPFSAYEIKNAMNNILINKDLRIEYKKRGLERVKQFNWKKYAKETLNVYEEVFKKA